MGPHRIIHNRRGYLTESYFDEVTGKFSERPFPSPARAEPPTVTDHEQRLTVPGTQEGPCLSGGLVKR